MNDNATNRSASPWVLHPDGSFDLVTPAVRLANAWPAVDHQPVRCARVSVEPGRIRYHMERGTLTLRFGEDHGLSCQLDGFTHAPHWVHPLHGARLEATHLFRQGIGFSGPTGPLALADLGEREWSVESYLLLGFFTETESATVLAPLAHRDFLFRANLHTRVHRHNFRNRDIEAVQPYAELGFRTERIPLEGPLTLPELRVQSGEGLFETLRGMAGRIADANGARVPQRPRYHYCSWYHHASHLTEAQLLDTLDGIARIDPNRHVQTIQIDDGYQTSRGDWLSFDTAKWPRGLRPVIDAIREKGYAAGVWVGPFMVGETSTIARDHPDWLLHDKHGERIAAWKHYASGSPDFEHYVLDTSHPDALAWIAKVFRTFSEWGVRFFKTDFLEWGYRDSVDVRRHTPGKTGAQYFDDALRTIREAIGEESYWLGCISYFAPCIGYMDGMRVASDTGVTWNSHGGTGNDGCGGGIENMIEETYASHYMNHVFWQNDPDAVLLRDWHIHQTLREVESLSRWHGLLGGSVNTSDELGDLPPERLRLWQWMRPPAEPASAMLPYFATGHPFRVVVRDYPDANGWGVLLLNESGEARLGRCRLRDLVGLDEAVAYPWRPGETGEGERQSEFVLELAPHGSALFFVSRDGAPPPADLLLGGARADGTEVL